MFNFRAGNPKASLAVVAVITTLATIVLILVGMTGLTKNSKPTSNIYLGSANISRIKVAKVMPETENIVQFLGLALDANSSMTDDQIFSAFHAMAPTAALKPLLEIMINIKKDEFIPALKALDGLKDLSGSTNENDTAELKAIYGLMNTSTNVPTSMEALKSLVNTSLPYAQDIKSQEIASNLTVILEHSLNPAETIRGLMNMTKLSALEKTAIITLRASVNNAVRDNTTVDSYARSMSVIADHASSEELQSALSDLRNNLSGANETADGFSSRFEGQTELGEALANVVRLSSNITDLVDTVSALRNDTTNAILWSAYGNIMTNIDSPRDNGGSVLGSMTFISNIQESIDDEEELKAQGALLGYMYTILTNTNSQKQSLLTINALNKASTNATKVAAVPHLFALYDDASEPLKVFAGMVGMTSFGIENPDILHPVLDVLSVAARSNLPARSVEQLQDQGRTILSNFQLPEVFKLGLFNLQAIWGNGTEELLNDGKGVVVQGFDYRSILYKQLLDSQLHYYVKALDIGADDLHLDGELLDKQPLYRPSIYITFVLYIIALVSGVFLIVSLMGVSFGKISDSPRFGWLNRIVVLLFAAGAMLSASIVSLAVTIIKVGSRHDDYGVEFKHGPAYYGLVWSAAVLSCITVLIVWLPVLGKKSSVNLEEGHASTSDEDLEKDRALRSHASLGR